MPLALSRMKAAYLVVTLCDRLLLFVLAVPALLTRTPWLKSIRY